MPTIEFGNQNISYTIKKSSRARRLRLSVNRSGAVIVSVPRRVSNQMAEKFLRENLGWVLAQISRTKISAPLSNIKSIFSFDRYKARAKKHIVERLRELNKFYNFSYVRISVKDHSSRWGSCSAKKNLNFNYRLYFLPPELADYVIVHELCHLEELNHSRRFWNLVARGIPNYLSLRRRLRQNSLL